MSGRSLEPIDFKDFLVERKALTEEQLLDVLAEHWGSRTELADAIVRRGYRTREEVDALVREYGELHVVYV